MRPSFHMVTFPYGELFYTAKFSFGENSLRRNFLRAKFPTAKIPTTKFPSSKIPLTILNTPYLPSLFQLFFQLQLPVSGSSFWTNFWEATTFVVSTACQIIAMTSTNKRIVVCSTTSGLTLLQSEQWLIKCRPKRWLCLVPWECCEWIVSLAKAITF